MLEILEMLELRDAWVLAGGVVEDVEGEKDVGEVDVAGGEVDVTVERVSMGCMGTLLRWREGRRGGVEDMVGVDVLAGSGK